MRTIQPQQQQLQQQKYAINAFVLFVLLQLLLLSNFVKCNQLNEFVNFAFFFQMRLNIYIFFSDYPRYVIICGEGMGREKDYLLIAEFPVHFNNNIYNIIIYSIK